MAKKRLVYLTVILSWLISPFAQPALTHAQKETVYSADIDSDGLSNDTETGGWCNAAGCFTTDPANADSDNDGLTDGEEKLFDANPLNSRSPGIYVEYTPDFQTKRYYPWQRFGSAYIALPDWGLNAAVVRRGSTFSVGGPISATLTISKSIPSLTTLTPVRSPCSGRWDISVPITATVGIYTTTMQESNWSASLSLYVIFQLPTNKTDAFVDAFVYDDNPDSTRDTSSIGYYEYEGPDYSMYEYTHQDFAWIPEDEWIAHGYLWRFNTQHYTNFVFRDHVMPAINGQTSTWNAANALVRHVDDVTCFGYPRVLSSSWCVLNPSQCGPDYNNKNQCTNIANLLVSMNRAAGIPSRTVFADWIHGSFDHSTEVWTKPTSGSEGWYVARGYNRDEYDDPASNHCASPSFTGGSVALRTTSGWYYGSSDQGVYAADENWGDLGGANPWWDVFRLASWDLDQNARTAKIVKKSFLETRFKAYWNWPSEPQVIGAPPYDWPSPPPPPAANFTGNPLAGSLPLTVTLTDQSTGHIRTWLWNFGDGITSNLPSPTHTYTTTGDFTVTLVITGAGGSDTEVKTNYIHISEPPVANFSGSPTVGARPLAVTFSDQSTGVVTGWSWRFGDGGISAQQNPSHTYNAAGVFTASLTANGPGGSDTVTKTNYIRVEAQPGNQRGLSPSPPETRVATPSANLQKGSSNPVNSNPDPVAQFGQVEGDYGVDLDKDGRFDQLVFKVQVKVTRAGHYWLRGMLAGNRAETVGEVYLEVGYHTIELPFNGMDIYMGKVDGPYTLQSLWITDVENPSPADFAERDLAFAAPAYKTSAYRFSDFGVAGATLSGRYEHHTVDTNGDGYADALMVETGLSIERAGTYTVQGVLYKGQDELPIQAAWTGAGPQVTLQFNGLRDNTGPYTLQYLYVRNASGQVTDGMVTPLALGAVPELSAKPILLGDQAVSSLRLSPLAPNFVITNTGYSDAGVDTDGDGLFDRLVITVTVNVEPGEGGQAYRIEGWLVDANNSLLSWAIGNSRVLTEGLQSLTLAFDGRILNEHGVDGPYTLMALKALPGNSYNVLNKVDVAYTTSAYSHNQFERVMNPPALNIFADNMEHGASQWTAQSPWSLDNGVWHSYSHAWRADASGSQSSSLTTRSLNLSDYVRPSLRFQTCYDMQSANDRGYLEASPNGVNWTRVVTFTNSTTHWSTQLADLSGMGKAPNPQLRFKFDSQTRLRWYVDDVRLDGWPAIKSAAFDYSPKPALAGAVTTLSASYTSITHTLPITYTWDLGDGSAPIVTHTPTMLYRFRSSRGYTVQLTVENPYDSAMVSQFINIYQPVEAALFSFYPSMPAPGAPVTFIASSKPVTATQPVTYTWSLGGPTLVVTTATTMMRVFDVGNYPVSITATNGYGPPVAYSDLVKVRHKTFLPLIFK